MHNTYMIGVQSMDRFSLRGCFMVIGTFGIVTLISYFNELAKAGLLSGHPRIKPNEFNLGYALEDRQRLYQRDLEEKEVEEDRVLLQKDGDLHHLGLNLLPLQREFNKTPTGNKSLDDEKGEQEIQIALHLGKDDKYTQGNTSNTKMYVYHNVMPNFFIKLADSIATVKEETSNSSTAIRNFTKNVLHRELLNYRNKTKVLLYQHDPAGYAMRDCLLSLSIEEQLIIAQAPLNALYRHNWEMMQQDQKKKFQVLYGGLSFGACESRSEPCSYAAIVSHPLDRLLQAYWLCRGNNSRTMCRFLKMDNMSSIRDFLERHGSSFFQKLLYYSRHCRLVGQDEVCIHDNNVYFVLTQEEKEEYLKEILSNVENWFSVVGIQEELDLSLNFLRTATGLNFPECLVPKRAIPPKFFHIFHNFHRLHHVDSTVLSTLKIDGVPYYDIRENLIRDNEVSSWISADMAIYDKFVEIFHKQTTVYDDLKQLLSNYYNPEEDNTDTINSDTKKMTQILSVDKSKEDLSNDAKLNDLKNNEVDLSNDAKLNDPSDNEGELLDSDHITSTLKYILENTEILPMDIESSSFSDGNAKNVEAPTTTTKPSQFSSTIPPEIESHSRSKLPLPVFTSTESTKMYYSSQPGSLEEKLARVNRPLLHDNNIFSNRRHGKHHRNQDIYGDS